MKHINCRLFISSFLFGVGLISVDAFTTKTPTGSRVLGHLRYFPNKVCVQRSYQITKIGATAADVLDQNVPENSISKSDVVKIEEYSPMYWRGPVVAIALPALIGMIADPLLSLVDTIFVGKLGASELASLGACTSIFHLAFNTFKATTSVTTSLVSGAIAKEGEDSFTAKVVTLTSLQFATVAGVIVLVLMNLLASPALRAMGISTESNLFHSAIVYLKIRIMAAPAVLAITVCEGAFRGRGDTRTPLLASALAAISNLVLDPLLMFGPTLTFFLSAPLKLRFGIGGAATATAASQYIAAIVYLICLKKKNMLPSNKRAHKNRKEKLVIVKKIIIANGAMLLRQLSLLMLWAFATARAVRIGYEHVAAHQVSLSYWLIFALLLDAPAVAAQVITNRILFSDNIREDIRSLSTTSYDFTENLKANDRQYIFISFLKFIISRGALLAMTATLSILSIPKLLPSFYDSFSNDPLVVGQLKKIIPILGAQQVLVGLCLCIEGILSGAGKFTQLAMFTNISAALSFIFIKRSSDISEIWTKGINGFFLLRFLTGCLGVLKICRFLGQGSSKGKVNNQFKKEI